MERKTHNGVIFECFYCGEDSKGNKYCSNCKTQKGRKDIFEANAIIQKEKEFAGLPFLSTLKNWK